MHPADAGRQRKGKPLGRHLHDVGRQRRRRGLRLVQFRRREDGVPARGDQAARLPDRRRRAQRPVPRAHGSTRTPIGPDGSLYACPGFTGETRSRPATSTTAEDSWRDRRSTKFDRLAAVGRCAATARSSRCAPGDARGVAQRAWRHEHADMSQAQLRGRGHRPRPRGGGADASRADSDGKTTGWARRREA